MKIWRWIVRRHEIDRDLQDEIGNHLSMAARDRVDDGADPEAARLAARKEFGNVLRTTEATRRVWRGGWLEWLTDVWQDARFGVRMIVKNPGFSLVVIAVLTLGIGGNAVVFSVFKGLALEPLPGVKDSATLAVVVSRSNGGRQVALSYPDYRYFRDHNESFTDLAGCDMAPLSLGLGSRGERVWGEIVTGNYFQALGVHAQLGRTLSPADDVTPGKHPVAVINDGMWRRTFGSDPAIVGKTIQLNAHPYTVVGVLEPRFQGSIVSLVTDVFVPLMMLPQLFPPDRLEHRGMRMLIVFGHLRPGVTRDAASARLEVQSAQLDADQPVLNMTYRSHAIPIWQSPYGAQTYLLPVVSMLGGTGILLLLVVCANVANLVMVRGASRRGEVAVRLALGASRSRILRLLLVENLVLAVPGALLGVALARVLLPFLSSGAAAAAPMRVSLNASTDVWVLGFSLLLSCASALVFGFVPALQTSRVELASVMKDESPRGAARSRLRSALVVAQVAVSLLLLVGAGLVTRSLIAARQADGGFDSHSVSSVAVDLEPSGYDSQSGRELVTRLFDAFAASPEVESASVAAFLPLTLVDGASRRVTIEGYEPRSDEDLSFLYNVVSADYFRTLRVPIISGRPFERRDDEHATGVTIVNETLARRMWQTPEAALGKRLKSGGDWLTIVGVAQDLKYARLTEAPRPYFYLPFLQAYTSSLTLHVRASDASTDILGVVSRQLHATDPNLPLLTSKLLIEQTRVALSPYEMAAGTLLMFGIMTILLSALGIYGLVAYTIEQSTQEIGVRMAIGASRLDVVRQFFGRGLTLAALGMALGLIMSVAVTRLLAAALYGVSATDAASFVLATAIVAAIALAASFVPAWRASRLDPLAALRHR
ncbi:MAG: ABC transporter permease [Vicinamibacterales bacterium]